MIVGIVGNTLGAVLGWAIGYYGGHPLLERHGRFFHATPERIARAERWFERFGTVAVSLGFATPLVRSFVALPAGILEWPLRRLTFPLAAIGCLVFSAASPASAGRSARAGTRASHDLRYIDYAVVVLAVALAALIRLASTPPRYAFFP